MTDSRALAGGGEGADGRRVVTAFARMPPSVSPLLHSRFPPRCDRRRLRPPRTIVTRPQWNPNAFLLTCVIRLSARGRGGLGCVPLLIRDEFARRRSRRLWSFGEGKWKGRRRLALFTLTGKREWPLSFWVLTKSRVAAVPLSSPTVFSGKLKLQESINTANYTVSFLFLQLIIIIISG